VGILLVSATIATAMAPRSVVTAGSVMPVTTMGSPMERAASSSSRTEGPSSRAEGSSTVERESSM